MYEVTVEETFAAGLELDATGLLVDFVELKRLMREVVAILDHQFINDLEPFTVINPSAENMAKYFYDYLAGGLHSETPLRVSQVKLWETDTASATYRG
jgi:6-pyruvoyltetrahydropterin/6-carboxytetrahydropterin synthase